MAKKIYQVKGTELKRSTDRDYTHAVVITKDGEILKAENFCGSYQLATNKVHEYENFHRDAVARGCKAEIMEVERIK